MSSWPSTPDRTLKPLPWLLVVLGPILLLGPALATGQVLYWGTPLLQFVPWHDFAAESILRGELPLWNPLVGMGAPLLANYQSGVLYPPNWSMLIVEPAVAQTALTMLHLIVAGLGMVLLCRRLGIGEIGQAVAGLGFSLSGYMVARSGFQSINNTVAWLPWMIWAAEGLVTRIVAREASAAIGRAGLVLSGVLGLQWLAGHAQTAWYSLLMTAAWVAWRLSVSRQSLRWRPVVAFLALTLGLAFSLAAAQLLPTLEYLLLSPRSQAVDPAVGLTYSLWPWRLLGWLLPGLFGHPAYGGFWGYANYWEDALYIGMLAFLLAVTESVRAVRGTSPFTGRSRFLAGVVLVSLVLALGKNTPIYPFLFRWVPTFDLFQAPTRWSLLAVFALCLLAADGADAWRAPQGRGLYWTRLGTAGAAGMIGFALLAGRLLPSLDPSFIRSFAIAGATLTAVGVLTLTRSGIARLSWSVGLGLFLLSDLLLAVVGLNPTISAAGYRGESALTALESGHRLYMPAAIEEELKFEAYFRFDRFDPDLEVETVRASGLPNTPMLDGIPSANNFDPLLPARYAGWIERLEGADATTRERVLAFMDVGWVAEPGETQGLPDYRAVSGARRLRFVPDAVAACSPEDALEAAFSGHYDLEREVVLEVEDCRSEPPGGGPGWVEVLSEGSSFLELKAGGEAGGWVVVSDLHYPGWRAQVDGRGAAILPANGAFRAIWLPAGTHTVRLEYRPAAFSAGLALTAAGLMAMLGLGWVWRRR